MLQQTQLPAAARAAALRVARQSPPATVRVWIDNVRHLLRRMTVDMSLGGLPSAAGGSVTLDFGRYGTPVTIDRPPAHDVIGYQGLLRAMARHLGGH